MNEIVRQTEGAKTLSQMNAEELLPKMAQLLTIFATDMGVAIPSIAEWQMNVLRISRLVSKYFPTLTIEGVSEAFEMMAVGMLDNYLPRDAQGQPDKKHYGQMSVEYVARVLNAYQKTRRRVHNAKAKQLPAYDFSEYKEQILQDVNNAFRDFKGKGSYECSYITEMLIYNELVKRGYICENVLPLESGYNIAFEKCNETDNSRARRKAIEQVFAERESL